MKKQNRIHTFLNDHGLVTENARDHILQEGNAMLKWMKSTIAMMLIAGVCIMPAWAQDCPPSQCSNVVAEVEPNDLSTGEEFQDLGMLAAGDCITISPASISQAFNPDNPDASDLDVYVLWLNGVSQLDLTLNTTGQVPFQYIVFDPRTEQIVADCTTATCQAQVQTDVVMLGVVAAAPLDYDLTITAAGSNVGPFGASNVDAMGAATLIERMRQAR